MELAIPTHPRRRVGSWAFDVVLAVTLTAIDLSGSIGEAHPSITMQRNQLQFIRAHPPGAAYALVVVGGLALIWRRRWPRAVLIATVGATTAYTGAGYVPGAALDATYVALYTVASTESRPVAMAAGAGSAGVLFVSSGVGGPFGWLGGTNTVMVSFSIAAVAMGMAVAGRRQIFAAMFERAERAERDRDEETRRRVDAERLRIARELHDVVAHSMSMIHVQAGVAAHVMASQPEQAEAALVAIKAASRNGLRELRAILNVLRQVDEEDPDRLPAPQLSELAALADATSAAGLPTTVVVSGRPLPPLPTVELAAYRIVQESLTNVLRHGGADAHAQVRVVVGRRKLLVQIDDDGDPEATTVSPRHGDGPDGHGPGGFSDGTGAGIAGMRERAGAFGGHLHAGPRPGGGWRVRAVLSLTDSAP